MPRFQMVWGRASGFRADPRNCAKLRSAGLLAASKAVNQNPYWPIWKLPSSLPKESTPKPWALAKKHRTQTTKPPKKSRKNTRATLPPETTLRNNIQKTTSSLLTLLTQATTKKQSKGLRTVPLRPRALPSPPRSSKHASGNPTFSMPAGLGFRV